MCFVACGKEKEKVFSARGCAGGHARGRVHAGGHARGRVCAGGHAYTSI